MQTTAADFQQRRRHLARLYPHPVLLESGPKTRNRFRAESFFLYFGGWNHPNLTMLLQDGEATLFYDPPETEQAIWEGPGPDLHELKHRYGLSRIASLREMPQAATRLNPEAPEELLQAAISLRLLHDQAARNQLEQAVDMSVRAHFQAMRATRPERWEFQILATLLVSVTQEGGSPAFEPVVSTRGEILRNRDNQGTLQRGDLLLVDFGARTSEGWSAGLTRTYPVRTNYSSRQAEIYEVVLAAQKQALAACRPGQEYRQVHRAACLGLTGGLVELGLMRGCPEDLVERGAHALFFPHGVGHLMGLDLRDMEEFGDRAGYAPGRQRSRQLDLKHLSLDRLLQPHMAVTVEPGFYWIPQLLENPEYTEPFRDCLNLDRIAAYKEVRGIRIGDNVLIHETGSKLLSATLPKEVQELEIVVNS
ncbi:aminopeptidase P N-terminal domain-containing protein [bacterium]|nr:aminopeptidase P N-terminal domain-containing protein [bacterium]